MNGRFTDNSTITSFDELKYFTGLASIGNNEFLRCTALTSITLPDNVTSIGNQAFLGSGLKSIELPEKVTSIGETAFSGCTSLKSVSTGSSVNSIGKEAFAGCTFLKSFKTKVEDPNTITLGADVWKNVTLANANLFVPVGKKSLYQAANQWKDFGVVFDTGDAPIANITFKDENVKKICVDNWDTNKDGELDLEEAANVTILDGKFKSNTTIVSFDELVYFARLVGLYYQEFIGCTSLESIKLPNSVKNIGVGAFSGCQKLTSVTIPSSVTTLYKSVFSGCGFTSFVIPDNITTIGESAFSGCTNLASITIPTNITVLPTSVFSGCGFTSFVIPDNITSIGESAFSGCANVETVALGSAVNNIGKEAFAGCTALKSFTSKAANPSSITLGADVWKNVNLNLAVLHVPAGKKTAYKATDQWKDFGEILGEGDTPSPAITFVDDNIKGICVTNWDKNKDGNLSEEEAADVTSLDGKFKGNTTITSFSELSYFTGLTAFGEGEFSGCSSLTSVTIPSSITVLPPSVFSGCGFTSYVVPDNITSIGESAFSGCASLSSVTLGSAVNNIGKEAFAGCTALKSFTSKADAPSSITLGADVWKDINLNLAVLHVPASKKAVYKAANQWKDFGEILGEGDTPSPAITFVDDNIKGICVTNWDKNKDGNLSEEEAADVTSLDGKFKGNTEITSFNELSYFTGLTSFGAGEFSGCTSLASVTIPSKITTLPNSVFSGCAFTSFIVPDNITSIGESAFSGCTSLASVTLGSAVNSIGKEAFAGCTALKSFTSKAADPSSITLGEDVWKSDNLSVAVLYVPAGKKMVYKVADQWKNFGLILGEGDSPTSNITFAYANVKAVCIANWDRNSDGELSEEEAADVTSLEGKFKGNTAITTFAELSYFTGLTSFVEGEFSGCTSLASISIPTNITVLPPSVFSNCGFTSFVIPDNITTIGASAFSGCASLETVALGSAVNSIGKEAFAGCNALKSFTSKAAAPSSITLGADVWKDVNLNVAVLYVPAGKKAVYKAANQWKNFGEILGEGDTPSPAIVFADVNVKAICIDNWDKNEDGNLSEEEAADVTSLDGKFMGNTAITSFNELSYFTGLTSFGANEFSGCTSLASVTIPSKITTLPNSVFSGCAFTSFIVPDNITSIGESAFSGCTSLASVTLGSAVNNIGKEAFAGCTALKSFTSKADVPSSITLGSDVWKNVNLNLAVLHVPVGKKTDYKAANQWKNFGLILGEGDSPTPNITFADANVKTVCVANWDKNSDGEISQEEAADVTSLAGKFKNNTTITSFAELSYFTGLTSFGEEEFSGCSSLATITIPSKFTALPTSVFSGCGFTSFTIPNNITTIGESAFSGCTKLASVTLGSAVKNIGKEAFAGCTGLTSFTTKVADPSTITLGSDVWKNVTLSNVPLTAPNAESLKKYSTAAQWSAFKYDFPKEFSFDENSDITSQLEELVNEGKRVDFTIKRTFYCDGYFNTICLPFSMTAAEIAASPIGGYKELKKFVKAEVKGKKKDEMNVNVGLSATKTIEAGVPYFISWHKGADIVNPTFENVLVTESVGKTISGGGMSCIGILTPTVLDPTVNNLLFLGEANWLYWSNDMTPLKAFRAYFSVNSVSMVNFRKDMPAYFVDMDNVTGIETIVNIESRPVKYLENGKVVIEKNGVKYDTMGRVIK